MKETIPYLSVAVLTVMAESPPGSLFRADDFDFHEWKLEGPDIGNEADNFATDDELLETLRELEAHGLLEKLEDPYTQPDFTITDAGREYLYAQQNTPKSLAARYAQRRNDWLFEALGNIHRAQPLQVAQPAGLFEQPGGFFAEALTAPPSASTAPTSSTFGLGPNRANFDNGNFNAPPVGQIPAADRYVSVKDNQPAFDELVARLSAIKDEYARDHNHLAAEPAVIEMLSEIDAVLAQIKRGVVRWGQIAYGLLPSFNKVCIALAAYPALVQLIHDATPYAQAILNFFGHL